VGLQHVLSSIVVVDKGKKKKFPAKGRRALTYAIDIMLVSFFLSLSFKTAGVQIHLNKKGNEKQI
jgi:hypothetical protein